MTTKDPVLVIRPARPIARLGYIACRCPAHRAIGESERRRTDGRLAAYWQRTLDALNGADE